MRRYLLDRYVFREILGPLGLGLVVFTFILLMDVLFDLAELVIRRDVPALEVLRLIGLNLPHILVLTVPMAFLYGLLIAIGRMSADSELVAIRASGLGLFSLYRPVLALSSLLAVIACWMMIEVLPWSNTQQRVLSIQLMTQGLAQRVKPRIFHEELEDRILYVFGIDPESGRWQGVFLAEALPKTRNQVIVARAGELLTGDDGEAILSLQGSVDQMVDLDDPKSFELRELLTQTVRLGQNPAARASGAPSTRDLRAMTIAELQEIERDADADPAWRNVAQVELHKKFAIPAACLVFGLFGLPLGFSNRRGGRSSGFAISTLVILAYHVLLNSGEEAAARGRMEPWLAMWIPNLVFSAAGLFLLARRNLDRGLLPNSLDRFLREHLWSRLRGRRRLRQKLRLRRQAGPPERAGRAGDIVLRLPRFRLRFPNIFDRYVIRLFAQVFVVVVAAVLAVYVVANFTDLVDDVLEHDVSSSVVIDYYKYFSLQVFYQMAPIVVLLTTLITYAILSYSNEITAAKALGLSLYRLTLPALATALVVAALSVALDSAILPHTNARVAELKDRIKGRERVRTYRRADRQWLYGAGGYIYNYQYYDARHHSLQRLQVFRVDEVTHRLTGRLYASAAVFQGGAWWMTGGWARSFNGAEVTHYRDLVGPVKIDLPEAPEFFDTEIRSPEQMSYTELRRYVRDLRRGGQEVPELEVQLHNKVAMPFVCLVMALVALPFAFRLGKRGALYGVGLSLVLGMGFYAVIAFFTTLGETAALPAVVAVWSPNVLFATVSIYLFLGVRS